MLKRIFWFLKLKIYQKATHSKLLSSKLLNNLGNSLNLQRSQFVPRSGKKLWSGPWTILPTIIIFYIMIIIITIIVIITTTFIFRTLIIALYNNNHKKITIIFYDNAN